MPGDTDVKQLLLQVDASAELLRRNMAEAEAVVTDFDKVVERELGKIEQRFSGLKTADLSNSVRAVKQEFADNFRQIEDIAAKALASPLKGGMLDVGAGQAREIGRAHV